MTSKNEQMRAALREIESRVCAALAQQPHDAEACFRHLNKALAGIECKAYSSRRENADEGTGLNRRQRSERDERAARNFFQTGICDNYAQSADCHARGGIVTFGTDSTHPPVKDSPAPGLLRPSGEITGNN